MNSYLERREQLIHEDRAHRVDSSRLKNLTDVEAQADRIVRRIRADEAQSIWGTEGKTIFDYVPEDTSPNVFPGMAFLTCTDFSLRYFLAPHSFCYLKPERPLYRRSCFRF